MTKQEALKKLNKKHKHFDIQLDQVSGATSTVRGQISLFEHTDKGAVVLKKIVTFGTGSNINEAQDAAIINAIEGLGL